MGCDIHTHVQVWEGSKWRNIPSGKERELFVDKIKYSFGCFGWRSYRMFEFLAGVRAYEGIPGFAARGMPQDAGDTAALRERYLDSPDYHSASWITECELQIVDYETTFLELARGDREASSGRHWLTLREALGERFFDHSAKLAALAKDPRYIRVVFWFDN